MKLVAAYLLNLLLLLEYGPILLFHNVVQVVNLPLLALDQHSLLLVGLPETLELMGVLFELHLH